MKIVILMGRPNRKGSTSVSDDTKLIEGKVLNRGISAESLKDWISGLGI